MTAEVIVMNKLAIALAADSAVTIGYQNSQKIYNSANKLFMLSHKHPVGVMFYGNAEFMDIPLEVIVKLYSDHLGDKLFDNLAQYGEEFISFLSATNNDLFPIEQQDNYLENSVRDYFKLVREDIAEEIQEIVQNTTEVKQEDIISAITSTIQKHYDKWSSYSNLEKIPVNYESEIEQKCNRVISEIATSLIGNLNINRDIIDKIRSICVFLTIKQQFPVDCCGVVFAGFGSKEIFPSTIHFGIEAIINGFLKCERRGLNKIEFDNPGAIMSFAQSEMVATFIEGINPLYRNEILIYLGDMFDKYPEILLEIFSDISNIDKANLLSKLKETGQKLLENFSQTMEKYEFNNHLFPIISNVANLPIDELAKMAEALVNLTSFKRRISMDAETVGGPIDVAVITKRDGFIWIRRKEYSK